MCKIYCGVNNVAREANKIYIGVNNESRLVQKIYVGVDGVARVELGTPVGEDIDPGSITNTLVFPFGSYKAYAQGDGSNPTPVTILDASNGSVISTSVDGYMFLDRFEIC